MSADDCKEYAKHVIAHLPEDPCASPHIKLAKVGQDDPRVDLRGAWGCVVDKGPPQTLPPPPCLLFCSHRLLPNSRRSQATVLSRSSKG